MVCYGIFRSGQLRCCLVFSVVVSTFNACASVTFSCEVTYSQVFTYGNCLFFVCFQPRLGRRRRSELDRLQVDMKFSGKRCTDSVFFKA